MGEELPTEAEVRAAFPGREICTGSWGKLYPELRAACGGVWLNPGGERRLHLSRKDDTLCQRERCWELTPAGKALLALLKVTGIFIEADAATNKKAKAGA